MRLLLVVNPVASAVTPRRRRFVEEVLSAEHDVDVVETRRRGHATTLVRDASAAGAECVIVFGGDGTLNEVANGLAGGATAVGVLPGGSTNVFARTIGMSNDPVEGALRLLAALSRRSTRRVGLGRANARYFLFHVGVGFDAAVVAQVERRAAAKRRFGQALFVYAAFATWFGHYDHSRPRFAVRVDGAPPVDDGYFAIALNSDPYTFLGPRPLHVAPDAGLDRALAVVTIRTLAFVPTLRLAASALGAGRPVSAHRAVDCRTDVAGVVITGYGPFPYQVDGDYLGDVERLEVGYEADVLTLVVP